MRCSKWWPALPGGVRFVNDGNGTATLSGKPTAKGTFIITFIVSDGSLPGAVQTFDLTVSWTSHGLSTVSQLCA